MDIEKFITLRPYLYHLTDESNLGNILINRTLNSTANLTKMVDLENRDKFLRTRRVGHTKIGNGKLSFSIRDQDPLYENIIIKNLKDGMNFGDFVYLLNSKVFFWAKQADLEIHYGRYVKQKEYPIILRAKTEEVFAANQNKPQFCKYNSGAPRCCSWYPEKAAPRGMSTFQTAEECKEAPSTVREVTFTNQCILPADLGLSYHISKPFETINS
jgi:hypothetical protein